MPTGPGYSVSVTLHVLAAIVWLGGMFSLGLVGAPVLRRVEPPALRQQLFDKLGRGLRLVGWIAIAVLLVTGVLNLWYRGWLAGSVLLNAAFWATPVGRLLAIKLAAVAAMLVISVVHDFVDGPAAGRAEPGSADAVRLRRRATWFGRLNALLGLVVVIVAVRLARGG